MCLSHYSALSHNLFFTLCVSVVIKLWIGEQQVTGFIANPMMLRYNIVWVWLLYVLKRVERQRKIHDDRFVKDHQGEFHVFHPQYSPKYSNRS